MKKVAIVADNLTDRGGAENVVRALARLFPTAPIFTSIFRAENFPEFFNEKNLQKNFFVVKFFDADFFHFNDFFWRRNFGKKFDKFVSRKFSAKWAFVAKKNNAKKTAAAHGIWSKRFYAMGGIFADAAGKFWAGSDRTGRKNLLQNKTDARKRNCARPIFLRSVRFRRLLALKFLKKYFRAAIF